MVRASESQPQPESSRQTAPVPGAVERDLVRAALDYLRGIPTAGGEASGSPTVARQKADLCEWAKSLGLLLTPDQFPAIPVRGGQEHDLFHDTAMDRYFKVIPSHPSRNPKPVPIPQFRPPVAVRKDRKNLYNRPGMGDINTAVSKIRPRAVRTFRVPILTVFSFSRPAKSPRYPRRLPPMPMLPVPAVSPSSVSRSLSESAQLHPADDTPLGKATS